MASGHSKVPVTVVVDNHEKTLKALAAFLGYLPGKGLLEGLDLTPSI